MSKLKVFNISVLTIILIIGIFISFNGGHILKTRDNSKEKKIELIRIEENITFSKNTTQFSSEPVTIEKYNTENKMVISPLDNIYGKSIRIKIFQDNNIIFNDVLTANGHIISYTINGDKSTFKLEVDNLDEVKTNDEELVNIVWYVNKGL